MPSYSRRPGSTRPAPTRAASCNCAGLLPGGASGAKFSRRMRSPDTLNATGRTGSASCSASEPPSRSMVPSCTDQGAARAGVAPGSTAGAGARCVAIHCCTIHWPSLLRATRARGWVMAMRSTLSDWCNRSSRAFSTRKALTSAKLSLLRIATPDSPAPAQTTLAGHAKAMSSTDRRARCAMTAGPFQASPRSASRRPLTRGFHCSAT